MLLCLRGSSPSLLVWGEPVGLMGIFFNCNSTNQKASGSKGTSDWLWIRQNSLGWQRSEIDGWRTSFAQLGEWSQSALGVGWSYGMGKQLGEWSQSRLGVGWSYGMGKQSSNGSLMVEGDGLI
jgi:hypothetical protein